jgi:hypothetical protein
MVMHIMLREASYNNKIRSADSGDRGGRKPSSCEPLVEGISSYHYCCTPFSGSSVFREVHVKGDPHADDPGEGLCSRVNRELPTVLGDDVVNL